MKKWFAKLVYSHEGDIRDQQFLYIYYIPKLNKLTLWKSFGSWTMEIKNEKSGKLYKAIYIGQL